MDDWSVGRSVLKINQSVRWGHAPGVSTTTKTRTHTYTTHDPPQKDNTHKRVALLHPLRHERSHTRPQTKTISPKQIPINQPPPKQKKNDNTHKLGALLGPLRRGLARLDEGQLRLHEDEGGALP